MSGRKCQVESSLGNRGDFVLNRGQSGSERGLALLPNETRSAKQSKRHSGEQSSPNRWYYRLRSSCLCVAKDLGLSGCYVTAIVTTWHVPPLLWGVRPLK